MTSGQSDLGLAVAVESAAAGRARRAQFDPALLRVIRADPDDLAAHRAWVDKLKAAGGGISLWPEDAQA